MVTFGNVVIVLKYSVLEKEHRRANFIRIGYGIRKILYCTLRILKCAYVRRHLEYLINILL